MRYAAVRRPPPLVGTDGVRPRMSVVLSRRRDGQCIDDVTAYPFSANWPVRFWIS